MKHHLVKKPKLFLETEPIETLQYVRAFLTKALKSQI